MLDGHRDGDGDGDAIVDANVMPRSQRGAN